MRYWLALLLCVSQVSTQELEKKSVEVQAPSAPQNMHTLVKFDSQNTSISGAKLSPDGRLVAVYGSKSDTFNKRAPQGVLQIWDVATRRKMRDLVGHNEYIPVVFWSHDGKRLVSQSQDGQTLLWNVETGQRVAELAAVDPTFARRISSASAASYAAGR